MKRNYLILTVLAVCSILFLQAGCQEQAGPAEKPKTALTAPKPAAAPSEKAEIIPEANQPTPKITFEKVVYDFGEIEPGTKKVGEFEFTNTGDGLLKITKVEVCCGCTATLSKEEYAPGESGVLKVECTASQRPGTMRRQIYVNSNDKANPRVALTIEAEIVTKISYQPKTLNLSLRDENAGCPEITLTSLDNKPFSIKAFKSTGDCITADVNSLEVATKFVISPKVSTEKLQKNLNGFVEISLTHPAADKITITYSALPEFKTNPPVIIIFKVEPQKPVKREIWILNNYNEDFEIESTSSKNDIIKVLSQEKISSGYHLEVEITPPAAESKQRIFTDVFSINIKGGKKLEITCRGFYDSGLSSSSR